MTVQRLAGSSPLLFRGSPPAARESVLAPVDSFVPDPQESRPSRWPLGLALGGLALVSLVPLTSIQQEVRQAPAQPVSELQRARLREVGQARPQDNQTAKSLREAYARLSERLLQEADQFQAQSERLQTQGDRLEWAGKELGPGTHQTAQGQFSVEFLSDGMRVNQFDGEAHRLLVREGEYLTVEVNEGQGATTLEVSPEQRVVTQAGSLEVGPTVRTLYLQDSVLHPAGEFEVRTGLPRRSEETLSLLGTRVFRQAQRVVSGSEGPEAVKESQKWADAEGELLFQSRLGAYNPARQRETVVTREVEVHPDGSSRTRSNQAVEQFEPPGSPD